MIQIIVPSFADVTALSLQDLEFPLNLFTAGNICHPYLSLPYLGNISIISTNTQ